MPAYARRHTCPRRPQRQAAQRPPPEANLGLLPVEPVRQRRAKVLSGVFLHSNVR